VVVVKGDDSPKQGDEGSQLEVREDLEDAGVQEGMPFKSPKISSLYRGIEEHKLINRKLPHQIQRT
jgi:hypothetical protein